MNLVGVFLLAAAAAGPGQPSRSPATSRQVAAAMFDAFNRHDAEAMSALYASDARLMSSDFCAARAGRRDVLRTYRALFAAYPDIHDEVMAMVTEGEQVAVRFVARSGNGDSALRMPIMAFLTIRSGQILSDESVFDTRGRPCSP